MTIATAAATNFPRMATPSVERKTRRSAYTIRAAGNARAAHPATIRAAVAKAVTYAIELAMGLGCLAGIPSAWRSPRRWLAPILAVLGLAAVVHAAVALAT